MVSKSQPTPPQNRRLIVSVGNIKQEVDNFVGELTFFSMMLEPALLGLPASLARFTSLDEALAALRDRQVAPRPLPTSPWAPFDVAIGPFQRRLRALPGPFQRAWVDIGHFQGA